MHASCFPWTNIKKLSTEVKAWFIKYDITLYIALCERNELI